MNADTAAVADGIRAANLFGENGAKKVSYLGLDVAPQKSTPLERQEVPTAIVFVLQCENDLAWLVLNDAKMELRMGDHLTIPTGSNFQFVNASLTTPLRMRVVQLLEFPKKRVNKPRA